MLIKLEVKNVIQKKQALKEKDRERMLNVKDIEPLSSTPVCSPVLYHHSLILIL